MDATFQGHNIREYEAASPEQTSDSFQCSIRSIGRSLLLVLSRGQFSDQVTPPTVEGQTTVEGETITSVALEAANYEMTYVESVGPAGTIQYVRAVSPDALVLVGIYTQGQNATDIESFDRQGGMDVARTILDAEER